MEVSNQVPSAVFAPGNISAFCREKCNPGLSIGALSIRAGRSRTTVAIMFSGLKHRSPRQEKLHSLDCETTLFINQRQDTSHPLNLCLVGELLRIKTCLDRFSERGYIRFSPP
jgi:hypothetical protein